MREELDDIAEDLADKLGIYSEPRSHWVYEFKERVRNCAEFRALAASPQETAPASAEGDCVRGRPEAEALAHGTGDGSRAASSTTDPKETSAPLANEAFDARAEQLIGEIFHTFEDCIEGKWSLEAFRKSPLADDVRAFAAGRAATATLSEEQIRLAVIEANGHSARGLELVDWDRALKALLHHSAESKPAQKDLGSTGAGKG